MNDANIIRWPMVKDEQADFLSAVSSQKLYSSIIKPPCHDAISQYGIDR